MRDKPYKIGITGTIGSGKSTVGEVLKNQGVAVLDTDQVVHQLYEQPDVIQEMVQVFGSKVIDSASKSIDRKVLSQIVFQHPEQKQKLEAIIHPKVRELTVQFLNKSDTSIRAALVPLLFEAESQALYDEIWCVVVQPEALLIERLERRHPDWTIETIKNRIASQWSQEDKCKRADFVIDNSKHEAALANNILAQLQKVKEAIIAVNS